MKINGNQESMGNQWGQTRLIKHIAGMVVYPGDYRWSSFRCNAMGMPDALVTPHEIYQALAPDDALRQQYYRTLFDHLIAPAAIDVIREATNKGWVLGNDGFKEQIRINRV